MAAVTAEFAAAGVGDSLLHLSALSAQASAPWEQTPVHPRLCFDGVQVAQRWKLETCCRFFTLPSCALHASVAHISMQRSDCLIIGNHTPSVDLHDLHIEGVLSLLSQLAVTHMPSPEPAPELDHKHNL